MKPANPPLRVDQLSVLRASGLPKQDEELLEALFEEMSRGPVILTELADRLNIPYATFYERLEKALQRYARRIRRMADSRDYLREKGLDAKSIEPGIVTRLLEFLRLDPN
jgi:Holliday junction resolvasome RuvABC ATP-dependent DNA helicase subunit